MMDKELLRTIIDEIKKGFDELDETALKVVKGGLCMKINIYPPETPLIIINLDVHYDRKKEGFNLTMSVTEDILI